VRIGRRSAVAQSAGLVMARCAGPPATGAATSCVRHPTPSGTSAGTTPVPSPPALPRSDASRPRVGVAHDIGGRGDGSYSGGRPRAWRGPSPTSASSGPTRGSSPPPPARAMRPPRAASTSSSPTATTRSSRSAPPTPQPSGSPARRTRPSGSRSSTTTPSCCPTSHRSCSRRSRARSSSGWLPRSRPPPATSASSEGHRSRCRRSSRPATCGARPMWPPVSRSTSRTRARR